MKTETTITDAIFNAFDEWISQRSKIDRADYGGSREAYNSDARQVSNDRKRARQALEQARGFEFNPVAMAEAFRAFSGRLQWDGQSFEYTTGQYFPTEFAKAAAAVLETYVDAVRPKHTPATGQTFRTIADIKAAAHAAGSHWFDKSSMRFFSSKILPKVYSGPGGIFFVSSECSGIGNAPRRFTIRQFDPTTAGINTFGPFNELSQERAQRIARIAAENPGAAKEALEAGKGGAL